MSILTAASGQSVYNGYAYVHKMKKSELQESLLRLLYEGPEWQCDRFIRDNIR